MNYNYVLPGAGRYNPIPHWSNKTSSSMRQRFFFAMVIMCILLGGGFGFFYFTSGKSPITLEAAPAMLLEQQRNLDVKVNRLLDALESMPALHDRIKDSKEAAPAPAAALSPNHNDNKVPSTGNTH